MLLHILTTALSYAAFLYILFVLLRDFEMHCRRLYVVEMFCADGCSLTGISPFRGRTTDETYLNITQATSPSLSAAVWQSVSDYAKDWISKLLVKDSKKRMSISEALAHPWLSVSGRQRFALKMF